MSKLPQLPNMEASLLGLCEYGPDERAEGKGNLRKDEVVMLKLTIAGMRSVLRDCLADYSHSQFTDRHGMADRIRAALNFTD